MPSFPKNIDLVFIWHSIWYAAMNFTLVLMRPLMLASKDFRIEHINPPHLAPWACLHCCCRLWLQGWGPCSPLSSPWGCRKTRAPPPPSWSRHCPSRSRHRQESSAILSACTRLTLGQISLKICQLWSLFIAVGQKTQIERVMLGNVSLDTNLGLVGSTELCLWQKSSWR